MSRILVDSIRSNSASGDAITLASDGTCTANVTSIGGGQLSNRNKVINGSMIIHQRGGSLTGNEYTLDRYKIERSTDGAYAVSQSTESPDDFSNSLHVDCTTADTSVGSSQYLQLRYPIEAQDLQDLAKGTSAAKKTVLSFYVKTNITGTYAITLYDADNNRQFVTTYTVSNTNWNRYTINIPADTTGALNNDNGIGLEIYWSLVQGSSRTSGSASTSWGSYALANFAVGHNVNFLSSTDNNWYLTGVQFEKSDTGVATDFEHRSFGQELALCQRYFYKTYDYATAPGTATFVGAQHGRNFDPGAARSAVPIYLNFPVRMRSVPTLTWYAGDGQSGKYSTGSTVGGTDLTDEKSVGTSIDESETGIYHANFTEDVPAANLYAYHVLASAEL